MDEDGDERDQRANGQQSALSQQLFLVDLRLRWLTATPIRSPVAPSGSAIWPHETVHNDHSAQANVACFTTASQIRPIASSHKCQTARPRSRWLDLGLPGRL